MGRNMSVVSVTLLRRFYTLQRKTTIRNAFRVSKYLFGCEIKLHSFCTYSFLKSNFTQSLSFDIGHTSQFSKQSSQITRLRLIGSHLYMKPINYKVLRFLTSSILYFVSFKPEIHLIDIYKFSSYLTEDTLRLHYKDQLVYAVSWNNSCLFWQSHETRKDSHSVGKKQIHFHVKTGGTYSDRYVLRG
jgi:hypothetical protein